MTAPLTHEQKSVVRDQVSQMLSQSTAFAQLPSRERSEILANTAAVVDALVQNRAGTASALQAAAPSGGAPSTHHAADPYAIGTGPAYALQSGGLSPVGSGSSGAPGSGTIQSGKRSGNSNSDFGLALNTGVAAAGALLQQVDFPNFVSSLVQGVFKAVVASSIEQMKAYGELVQSVAMSLNDFRDQNVSVNQGRDHLVSKFPNLFQVNIVDGQPRVGTRPGTGFDNLPNFKQELGLAEDVSDLDEETIEEKLVPAARDSLARSRQQMLATMVMMGINRIIVTDGKINAKLRFNFSAQDAMQQMKTAVGYESFGMTTTAQSEYDRGGTTGERSQTFADGKWETKTGAGNYFASGAYQTTSTPNIRVTNQEDTQINANLQAAAQLTGEVSLNFKSETFPLEKMIDTNQLMRLQSAQGAGRAAAPTGASGAPAPGVAPPPAAGTAPAPAPA